MMSRSSAWTCTRCSAASAIRWSARRRTGRRCSNSPAPSGRTSSSWTSRCPNWTASPPPRREQELIQRATQAGVSYYLVKPFREAELLPAIEIALARYREFVDLQHEVTDLKDALETRKVVERAKGILMETQGLKESDAFHRIRKASMDSRKSMRQVAEAILLTYEMNVGATSTK
jgi:response regulator RpfG family c-di-GMP phosphodiesterase